jgi:subtilisin family serine protease
MSRMIKVFVPSDRQDEVAGSDKVIEHYDAFAVLEVSDARAEALAQEYMVEDITDQYAIPVGDALEQEIDPTIPRVTASGRVASHPAYRGAKKLDPGAHHYLVQFIGPIKAQWLAAVRATGARVVDNHFGFTVIVNATADQIAALVAKREVRWAGHLPPSARIGLSLQGVARLPRTKLLPETLVVEFFEPAAARKAKPAVRKLELRILSDESSSGVLVIELPGGTEKQQQKTVDELARVHGVRMVRRKAINRISNDVAVGIMTADGPAFTGPSGLDGTGEVVGVCDTGLDVGTRAPAHPDFSGRVKAVKSYPIQPTFSQYVNNPGGDDGGADLDSGHGTHVAGSVLGDGAVSSTIAGHAPIRGIARAARLVFQAVEQAMDWKDPAFLMQYGRYLLTGIPDDLAQLFDDAWRRGVRVHTNSWGGGDPGVYDQQSRQVDQFIWDHPSMCILFSAGNDGSDADGNGAINLGSVTSPGTAKNCITVGASENMRRGFDGEEYGSWWPHDYPVPPFKDAPMADDADDVVAFSSRGPTQDGRMKPDVVAPGTWVLSTKSTMLSSTATGWAPFPGSPRYFYMGGTSMATPLTAGAVAVLRQYLRRDKAVRVPAAALLKAVLVAGVVRLPDVAPDGAVVDPHQGFGRVDLTRLVPTAGRSLWVQQNRRVQTGESDRVTVNVSGSSELRIVMAYSDFPGVALVNNLNLLVTDPDGVARAGNSAEGTAPSFDTVNNVEVVSVTAPATGAWTIEVIGANVPEGPQRFALAVLGPLA